MVAASQSSWDITSPCANPNGCLPIHLTGDRDRAKPVGTPFVLAVTPVETGIWSERPIKTGNPCIDAALATNEIPHFDLTVILGGYAFITDIRPEHHKPLWRVPCDAIPQSDLRPLSDLAPGRFLTKDQHDELLYASVV